MAAPGVDAPDLAAARHADALLGRLVTLHLRHGGLTLLSAPARVPVLLVSSIALATPVRRPSRPEPVRPRLPVRPTPVTVPPRVVAPEPLWPGRAVPMQAVSGGPLRPEP